ncbi:MAG: UvrD-helicase domain-containing protein, partial [Microbacteriaceae bacterium]|nr:UvrD-helicase domain-containing protein [Microbacteriaceae bacterium]
MIPAPVRVSHEQIAEAIAEPGKAWYPPTDEQRRIIEAPLAPALVVAGAGSGKTHTMMLRILWLIANEGVDPREILGLTFTRKAAGELRERVETGLHRLREKGLVELDEFDLPEVSTYNSFANTIYRQYALLVGREPDAVLLDEPGAVALMREVVLDSDDEDLRALERANLATITATALKVARAMRENRRSSAEVLEFIARFADEWERLPGKRIQEATKYLVRVDELRPYARLADEFERRKRARGFVEFSDQVATAAEIIERDPSIAAEVRAQARVVILDEYQDTSVA